MSDIHKLFSECAEEHNSFLEGALVDLIKNTLDGMKQIVTSWPPLEGMSEAEGEKTLHDMIMQKCDQLVMQRFYVFSG